MKPAVCCSLGLPHDNEASDLYWNTMNWELHHWHLCIGVLVTICKSAAQLFLTFDILMLSLQEEWVKKIKSLLEACRSEGKYIEGANLNPFS